MSKDIKKHKFQSILIVDDELEITKALVRQFKRNYTVFSATNAADALRIMETNEVQVIISDQRMPDITGVEFFTSLKTTFPDVIKLILTGYTDIEAAISAINHGQVFRYITKPWNPDELNSIIHEAFEKYELVATKKELIKNLTDAKINLEEQVKLRTQKLEEINNSLRKSIFEVEKKERILNSIFISIPGLLYLYDEKNKLIQWNRKHEIMTGYTAKELMHKDLMDWFEDDFVSQKNIDTALNKLAMSGFGEAEASLQKKDGSSILVLFTFSALEVSGLQYFSGIGIDITERKKAEVKLLEKLDELKMMNEFMVDRELKMLDLKKYINVLLKKLGEKEKYLATGEEID